MHATRIVKGSAAQAIHPAPNVSDPLTLMAELEALWTQAGLHDPCLWGGLAPRLIRLAGGIISEAADGIRSRLSVRQCLDTVNATNALDDGLQQVQQIQIRSGGSTPRSADGIMQADQGIFRFFEGCRMAAIEPSLEGIDVAAEAKVLKTDFWMCKHCGRPTSEVYASHMSEKHPEAVADRVAPLHLNDLLSLVRNSAMPAITLYSGETPLYRASNRAMRQWLKDKTPFAKWRSFAYLLDCELRALPRFEGNVYRAVPSRVPASLYSPGHVVTWNHPSSTSEDPRVARYFLERQLSGRPSGTIFIIRSATGRSIKEYSLHKEEKEVLFRAGAQFRVVSQADDGLKKLLEIAMRCCLADVEVFQMQELLLDSWLDLKAYLTPWEAAQNRELLDLVVQLPTHWAVHRNVTKRVCDPMSVLPCRERDKATALHIAAAVDHNLSCLHLATSQLEADAFGRLDCEGRTALDVAVDQGHEEAALHLFQRSRAWDQIAPHRLLTLVPWISKHQSQDQLKLVCSLLMEKCGKVVRTPSGNLREMDDGSVRRALQRAFYAAVLNKRVLEMELLIGLGACVSSPDLENKGYTPLMYAAQLGHVEGVATLLAAEASVDAQAKDGRTALMIASQHGHISAVRALLDAGAAVGITKANGRTAVMMASQNGHVMVIRALLEARALVATQDGGFGRTALMLASKNGHVPAIQELLRAGAAVNTCENDGHTACMFAAENGHVAATQALLTARADVTAATKDGATALSLALHRGHCSTVQVLMNANTGIESTPSDVVAPI